MIPLDAAWRAANPLPATGGQTSKNKRGRVLVVGGSVHVPGAIRLTGEAALRVGAGKIQLATVSSVALLLGIHMPEARVVALPQDETGEIAVEPADLLLGALERTDVAVLGPGMGNRTAAARLVKRIAQAAPPVPLVLDAAAVACAGPLGETLTPFGGRMVLTPHAGEMAGLLGCEEEDVTADPAACAAKAARTFGAVVALKQAETHIAGPDGAMLHYPGGGPGLATGGSGDVLAGAIGGLLSRGVAPLPAAAWGVWLHGEAGRALAARSGPIGFLGRELPPLLSGLLPR